MADYSLSFFRNPLAIPFPRSLSTALRAYRHGQIGIEAAMYRAGSVDSVHQRPLNIPLVQELLAKSGLDIRLNRPIAEELFENLEHPDREIADFAAQTLARLEERYYRELRRLEAAEPPETLNQAARRRWLDDLSRRYMDFASLQRFNRTLERYYLRKCVTLLSDDPGQPDRLVLRRIRARLHLGDLDAAAAELDARRRSTDPAVLRERLLLEGELAYRRRDLATVRRVMSEIRELEREHAELGGSSRRTTPWRMWL